MPSSANPDTPLWKRMLLRRLKFLAWLVAILVIVLGGSYLFAPQWLMRANFKREAMAAKLEQHSVQAGDTRWVYYEGGTGPTIVLLHGFASSKEIWLPVAKLLTPHFHLVIPDLPGWGESSRNADASYDIDAQAQRMDAFVQTLQLQRFVLVGHHFVRLTVFGTTAHGTFSAYIQEELGQVEVFFFTRNPVQPGEAHFHHLMAGENIQFAGTNIFYEEISIFDGDVQLVSRAVGWTGVMSDG